jgi:hypothetical protein
MTTPGTPFPESFTARIRGWFEKDAEPRIEAAEADTRKALEAAVAQAPVVARLANLVAALARQADPGAAGTVSELVTEAEAAVAEAARIAELILGTAT